MATESAPEVDPKRVASLKGALREPSVVNLDPEMTSTELAQAITVTRARSPLDLAMAPLSLALDAISYCANKITSSRSS